jgi:hypothetical protein
MDTSPLWVIWDRIVGEVSLLQDEASRRGHAGHLMNPVINTVYFRETAFSAKVFGAQYRKSGDTSWLRRAEQALTALQEQKIYAGLSEPMWTPRGTRFRQGSIPATAILLDAFWAATEMLGKDLPKEDWPALIAFLHECYLGHGRFAHDHEAARSSRHAAAVQNTAAMALLLMERAHSRGAADRFVAEERRAIVEALHNGQRSDGFWPYIHPGGLQSLLYRTRPLRPLLAAGPVARRYGGDRSILFGDAVHHCLVLYCLCRVAAPGQPARTTKPLLLGWGWIKNHMADTGQEGLRFNFEWEPVPHTYRYANFRDTTAYFLIMAIAQRMKKLGLLPVGEARQTTLGLLKYVASRLLASANESPPCIKAYEGAPDVLQYVFPRPTESVVWKGALLSDLILEEWATPPES